jgi:hypothetical protein
MQYIPASTTTEQVGTGKFQNVKGKNGKVTPVEIMATVTKTVPAEYRILEKTLDPKETIESRNKTAAENDERDAKNASNLQAQVAEATRKLAILNGQIAEQKAKADEKREVRKYNRENPTPKPAGLNPPNTPTVTFDKVEVETKTDGGIFGKDKTTTGFKEGKHAKGSIVSGNAAQLIADYNKIYTDADARITHVSTDAYGNITKFHSPNGTINVQEFADAISGGKKAVIIQGDPELDNLWNNTFSGDSNTTPVKK